MQWECVGRIGVDAGVCWIGDPCYIIGEGKPWEKWQDFCDDLQNSNSFNLFKHHSFQFQKGREGLGVVVTSGDGDGFYPVYVKKNDNGKIIEAKVVFK